MPAQFASEGYDPFRDLPFVDQVLPDGTVERRYLGRLPTPPSDPLMSALPNLEDATGISPIPRSDWPELFRLFGDRRYTSIPILDQNGVGACVSYAHTAAFMLTRARAGMPYVALSAPFLYTLINRGVDAGSTAPDAYNALTQTGICLEGSVQGRPIRPKGVNQAAVAEAARFKLPADARIVINTFEEAITAVAFGWQITFDVQAGARFDTNSEGSITYCGRMTNHEVTCGEGLRFNSRNQPEILGRNSWNVHWGQQGFGWFGESFFQASNTTLAMRATILDPQDASVPGLKAFAGLVPESAMNPYESADAEIRRLWGR